MKLRDDFRIEKAVSGDEMRPALRHGHLDAERGRLVATNGHLLVSVPCDVAPEDRTGAVPTGAIEAAREGDGIRARRFLLQGRGVLWARPRVDFPDYTQVIPEYRRGAKGHITVAINPHYLVALAEALGAVSRGLVLLTMPAPDANGRMYEPIVVEADAERDDDPVGVLMPGRW